MSKTGNTQTTGVFNNTSRIIIVKAQTKKREGTDKSKREVKRFKFPLLPGVLNMVPTAMWVLFKANKVVEALLDEEKLITGVKAKKVTKTSAKQTGPTKEEIEQQAILNELERNAESEDKENGEQ